MKEVKVGIIGFGTVGSAVAWGLHEKGHEISVYDIKADELYELDAEAMEPYQVPFLALNRSQITMLTPRHADDGEADLTPPPGDRQLDDVGLEPAD